jgi:hypothetical protein
MKMLCFYSVLHNQVVFVYNSEVFMRFGVLMAVTVTIASFWDVMLYSIVVVNRRFGGTCFLHYQGIWTIIHSIISQQAAGLSEAFNLSLYDCIFVPVESFMYRTLIL